MNYDCIIIGAGPAGLSAGLYLAQSKVKTLILEAKTPGGQILNTDRVENYLGMGNIEAWQMVDTMVKHTEEYGLEIRMDPVAKVGKEGKLTFARLESGEVLKSKTLILACGGTPRMLGIKGEEGGGGGEGVFYWGGGGGVFFRGREGARGGGGAMLPPPRLSTWPTSSITST